MTIKYFYFFTLIYLITALTYIFNFTAEDSYIVLKYSKNLFEYGELQFNFGESVTALTSPFHAIFEALLFFSGFDVVILYKIISITLLLISLYLLSSLLKSNFTKIIFILIGTNAEILLWSVGGLETPILLFEISLLIYFLKKESYKYNINYLYIISFLIGIAFVTRYDSIIFTSIISLYLITQVQFSKILKASIFAIIPALGWLIFSYLYYGDIFPTSLYLKKPSLDSLMMLFNFIYFIINLIFFGVFTMILSIFVIKSTDKNRIKKIFKENIWIFGALTLFLLYGLTMFNKHMMFGFRAYIPYSLVLAFVTASLFDNQQYKQFTKKVLLSILLIGNILGAYTIYNISLNGYIKYSPIQTGHEYKSLNLPEYINFMNTLKNNSLDIKQHSEKIGLKNPKIFTYAAGIAPYFYPDAYYFESLISYRKCLRKDYDKMAIAIRQGSDYIYTLSPRHSDLNIQVRQDINNLIKISSHKIRFDESDEEFAVYYNPNPKYIDSPLNSKVECNPNEIFADIIIKDY